MSVKLYKRIATVEFAVHGEEARVTVSNLPYIWNPRQSRDMDAPAAFAAIRHLRDMGWQKGLDVVSISTSPA